MTTAAEVAALLEGIPQRGRALGEADAPVTLLYFGDLQCPYCSRFGLGPLPAIVARRVRPGELLIEYRALEAATRDPEEFLAQQVAALAAGRQGKAWHFVEIFAAEQGQENTGYVTDAFLEGIAAQIDGLDLRRWADDRGDPKLAEGVAEDADLARRAGVSGTPSFLIGRTGGAMTRVTSSDQAALDQAIEGLLRTGPRGS